MNEPFTVTDDEIRIRAVTHETRSGWHRPSPTIRGLVRAVDEFVGDPTDDDLRRLAWEYYETVDIVKKVFEVRRDIKRHRLAGNSKSFICNNVWLDIEDAAIRELWDMRTLNERVVDIDERIAASLSSMPCNVQRGVVRNALAVKSRRSMIGIVRDREEIRQRYRMV